jgi:hypothetical protein
MYTIIKVNALPRKFSSAQDAKKVMLMIPNKSIYKKLAVLPRKSPSSNIRE